MLKEIFTRLRYIRQPKAAILMYHQVCDKGCDPWALAVHPDHFEAQLEHLKMHFNVVPMSSLADGVSSSQTKPTIAITFDDGFKDNCTHAAPLLDWQELPATFYVTTTGVRQDHVYWWDALQDTLFFSDELPVRLEMTINGLAVKFTFRSDRRLTKKLADQIRPWNYTLPIPNERVALYMLLWHHIRPLTYAEQNKAIEDIRAWADHKQFTQSKSVTMSVRDMQMLSQNPLFTVGAHSVHHAMLSKQSNLDQAYEIRESKNQLEKWTGKPVTGFAYPYGNFNKVTQAILREAGFQYAVSTEARAIARNDDPFALPRIQVRNWTVSEFASNLNTMIR